MNDRALSSYKNKNTFIYPLLFGSLAPGNSLSGTINIDGDSDFFWTKFAAWGMVTDDGTTVSAEELLGVTAIITNNSSGRQYMSAGVPIMSMAGNGGLPFILPMVTYIQAKAGIQVTLSNVTDNKTYTDIYISFIGIKAFL